MSHPEQQHFCRQVRERFPSFFSGQRVLEVGSLSYTGETRELFTDCVYTGIDVGPGQNVDVVAVAHEYDAPDASYDTIISTECLEHDTHYPRTLAAIVRLLRSGGLFVMTCASTGRPEHGTRRCFSGDAPLLLAHGEWADYYKNLSEWDIRDCIDVEKTFSVFRFERNFTSHDLYFWGLKK